MTSVTGKPLDEYEALHTYIQQVENEIDRVLEGTNASTVQQIASKSDESSRSGQHEKENDTECYNRNWDSNLDSKSLKGFERKATTETTGKPPSTRIRGDDASTHTVSGDGIDGSDEQRDFLDKKKEFERRKAAICFGIGYSGVSQKDAKLHKDAIENGYHRSFNYVSGSEDRENSKQSIQRMTSKRRPKSYDSPCYNRNANRNIPGSSDEHLPHYSSVRHTEKNKSKSCIKSSRKVNDLRRLLDTDRDAIVLGRSSQSQSGNGCMGIHADGYSDTHRLERVGNGVDESFTPERVKQSKESPDVVPRQQQKNKISGIREGKSLQKPQPPPRQKQPQESQDSNRNVKSATVSHHHNHFHLHRYDNDMRHQHNRHSDLHHRNIEQHKQLAHPCTQSEIRFNHSNQGDIAIKTSPGHLASHINTYSDPLDEEKKRQRSMLLERIYEDVKKITRPLQTNELHTYHSQEAPDSQIHRQPQSQNRQQQTHHHPKDHQIVRPPEDQQNCQASEENGDQNLRKDTRMSLPIKAKSQAISPGRSHNDINKTRTENQNITQLNRNETVPESDQRILSHKSQHRHRGYSDSETDFLQNFMEYDLLFNTAQAPHNVDTESQRARDNYYYDPFEPDLGLSLYQRVVKPKGKKVRRRSYSRDALGNISLAEFINLHGKRKSPVNYSKLVNDSGLSEISQLVSESNGNLLGNFDKGVESYHDDAQCIDDDSVNVDPRVLPKSTINHNVSSSKGKRIPSQYLVHGANHNDGVHHRMEELDTRIAVGHGEKDNQNSKCGAQSGDNAFMDPATASYLPSRDQTHADLIASKDNNSNNNISPKHTRSDLECLTLGPDSVTTLRFAHAPTVDVKPLESSGQTQSVYDNNIAFENPVTHQNLADDEIQFNVQPPNTPEDCSGKVSPIVHDDIIMTTSACSEVLLLNSESEIDKEPDYLEDILCGGKAENASSYNCRNSSDFSDNGCLDVSSGEEDDTEFNILPAFSENVDKLGENNVEFGNDDNNNNSYNIAEADTSLPSSSIETVKNGVNDNLYYNDSSSDFVCSEDDWYNAYPTVSRPKDRKGSSPASDPLIDDNKNNHESQKSSNGIDHNSYSVNGEEDVRDDIFDCDANDIIITEEGHSEIIDSLQSAQSHKLNEIVGIDLKEIQSDETRLTAHNRKLSENVRLQDTAIQTSLDLGDTVDISGTDEGQSSTFRRYSGISSSDLYVTDTTIETSQEMKNLETTSYTSTEMSSLAFSKRNKGRESFQNSHKDKEKRKRSVDFYEKDIVRAQEKSMSGSRFNKPSIMRSKSLHAGKDKDEKRTKTLNVENPSLSGSLKELSHLNIDVCQKLVDGEKMYVVTNGSPEMQVVVNALTPVLSRRNRSGRRSSKIRMEVAPTKTGDNVVGDISNAPHYIIQRDEEDTCTSPVQDEVFITPSSEEVVSPISRLPLYARLRSCDGSIPVKSNKQETQFHDSGRTRRKDLYRISDEIKQISQNSYPDGSCGPAAWNTKANYESMTSADRKLIGRSEDRYLVKEISTGKEELFLNPKFSNTWHGHGHGRSGTTHRVAPRMGVGMVFADNIKHLTMNGMDRNGHARDAPTSNGVMSKSMNPPSSCQSSSVTSTSTSYSLQTYTLPVISRTLLDAMHKRYCAHQYSRHNAAVLQPFSLLRLDPTTSHGCEAMTALRVEPKSPHHHEVVQVMQPSSTDVVPNHMTLTQLTSDGESDVSSSATDSLQSSPRQIHHQDATSTAPSFSSATLAPTSHQYHHHLHHHHHHHHQTNSSLRLPTLHQETPNSVSLNEYSDSLPRIHHPEAQAQFSPTETQRPSVSVEVRDAGTMTSPEEDSHEMYLHPLGSHSSDSVATTPSSSPRLDRLNPSSRSRAGELIFIFLYVSLSTSVSLVFVFLSHVFSFIDY